MIEIEIPGFGKLSLKHIVLDYNGTIALDGKLLNGVRDRLIELSESLNIHILTADTFGIATLELKNILCKLHILKPSNEDIQKEDYIKSLGYENIVAFGNGNNDHRMLKAARLSIAIIGREGCAHVAIQSADIIVTDINHGLELLLSPLRCKATLRF